MLKMKKKNNNSLRPFLGRFSSLLILRKETKGNMRMTLTAQELREMYADIKVIKNILERNLKNLEDHETRLKRIENFIQETKDDKKWMGWIYGSLGGAIVWLLSFLKEIFIK